MKSIRSITAGLVIAAACSGAPKPQVMGPAPSLTPTVELADNERLPAHLRLEQPQPAYVAVFFVAPGEATQLLYPTDSTGSKYLSGAQEIATSFATRSRTTNDTTRLLRRPGGNRQPSGGSENVQPTYGRGGGVDRGSAFNETYVLVYSATDSLSYKTLLERVVGISLPGYTNEAFNAVTKLIRAASSGNGRWSAVAVPLRR